MYKDKECRDQLQFLLDQSWRDWFEVSDLGRLLDLWVWDHEWGWRLSGSILNRRLRRTIGSFYSRVFTRGDAQLYLTELTNKIEARYYNCLECDKIRLRYFSV